MGKGKCTPSSYRKSAAYTAVKLCNDRKSLEILREFWKEEKVSPLDNSGDTILHFISIHGNVNALNLLVEEITSDDLKVKNSNGDTPLHEAARFGRKEIAEIMLNLENELILIKNNLGETPLYVAASSGKENVFNLLAENNLCDEFTMIRDHDGSTVLHAAISQEYYYFALQLLKMYPKLASKHDIMGTTALNILATKHSSFRSGSIYTIEQVGITPLVPMQALEIFIYFCIPAMYEETRPNYNVEDPQASGDVPIKRERSTFIKFLLGNAWLGEIDEEKQKHILALTLAKRLIEEEDWCNFYANCVTNPLIQATKLGINELVVEIIENCPQAIETLDEEDGSRKNILHIAAEKKNRFLFDYFLEKIAHKDNRMLIDSDSKGNTILHFAAIVGCPYRFSKGGPDEIPRGYKTMVHMPWGVLWFKRVKYCVHPQLWSAKNKEGMTAKESFERNYSEIRKEAEKTSREIANSVLILATLLCTINFAATFTVPGGFNDETGKPVLLKKEKAIQTDIWALMFFLGAAFYDAVFIMGTLLSILLSKFDSDDFYIALPLKCITGIISVYYSTACTVLACVQTLNVETIFKNKDIWWLAFTMYVLGCYMTLLLFDMSYLVFDYLYYFLRYSLFSYKRLYM